MASKFSLIPAIDLPISRVALLKCPQSIPLFPLLPLNSPSPHYYYRTRKLQSSSNAASEKVGESLATESIQDFEDAPLRPSRSKFVLVIGGTGGVDGRWATFHQESFGINDYLRTLCVDMCLFELTFRGGQLVVASLLNRNIKLRLLLRNPEKATTLFGEQNEEKLQVWKGDTRNPEDLDPSMFEGITHVICCTGTTAFPSRRWDGDNTPERVDWEGVRNLVLSLPSSLERIVLVSSIGVTKFNELPWSIMNLFGVLKYKKMGEDFVRNSGLPFTIIRAGRLTDGPYTSFDLNTLLQATAGERRAVVIDQGDKLVGEVSRLVVAEACVQALDIDFTVGQIYEVNSVQGDGPGSDPQKWRKLFKSAEK